MPDGNAKLSVLIEIQGQLAGLEQTTTRMRELVTQAAGGSTAVSGMADQFGRVGGQLGGLDAAKGKLDGVADSAHGVGDALKTGFAIEFAAKSIEGAERVAEALKHAVEEGVHFNAFVEDTRGGVAAVLRQFQGDELKDFNTALSASDSLVERIRVRSRELGVGFESAAEAYKSSAGAMFHAGVTDLDDQLKLIFALQSAMNALAVPEALRVRDIQDTLGGRPELTKFGREIGYTNAEAKAAQESGQVVQVLMEKLRGYAEAGAASQHNYTAELQRFRDTTQQLEGELAKPTFEGLKEGLRGLNDQLVRPETVNDLRTLGHELGDLAGAGLTFTRWSVDNAGTLKTLGEVVLVLGANFALLKIGDLVVHLGGSARAFLQQQAAAQEAGRATAYLAEQQRLADTEAARAQVAAQRVAEALGQQARAAQFAAEQAHLLALAEQEAATNRRLAGQHEAGELPGRAPQLYGPPIADFAAAQRLPQTYGPPVPNAAQFEAALLSTEAAAAPILTRMSASFTGFFASVSAGAVELGRGLYAALGPIGIGFILAEGLTAMLAHFRERRAAIQAELEDFSDKAFNTIQDFERRTAAVRTTAVRDTLMAELDRKLAEARTEVQQLETRLDPSRSLSLGEAFSPNTRAQLEAEEQKLVAAKATVGALDEQRQKLEQATTETLTEKSAADQVTHAVEETNQRLDDLIAKLPSIIAGLRDAAREAQLAMRLAESIGPAAKRGVVEGEHARLLGEANEAASKAGGYNVTLGGAQSALDQLQVLSKSAQTYTTEQKQALEVLKDRVGDLQKNEGQRVGFLRQESEEIKKQEESTGKSKADYESQVALFRAKAAGQTDVANALERERDVSVEATRLSKERGILYADALPLAREYVDLQNRAKDAEQAAKGAKKEGAASDRQAAAYAKDLYGTEQARRAAVIEELRARRGAVAADPFLFTEQKQRAEGVLLQRERQQLLQNILAWAQYNEISKGSGDPKQQETIKQNVKKMADAQRELLKISQGDRANSFGGGIQAGLVQWVNQIGTTSQQVAGLITNTLGHAIEGVSSAITGLITHTTTWRQAFSQVANAVVADIVKMVVQFAVQRGVMALVNLIWGETESAASMEMAQASAEAWAPAAISASTASYGIAAGAGLSAYLAALASGTGVAAGMAAGGGAGFMVGGYTGDGFRDEVAGAVHRREYVFDADATSRIGVSNLERLRRGAIADPSPAATGGRGSGPLGGSGGGARGGGGGLTPRVNVGGSQIHLVTVQNDQQVANYLESARGEAHVVRLVARNRASIGIRS